MKTSNKILTAAALALVFASCTPQADFVDYAIVAFEKTSFTVAESVGTIEIPVAPYSTNGKEFTATFKTVDGTAVSGVNYAVADNDASVLSFAAGDTLKVIKIDITDLAGTFTGSLSFNVELVSATDDVRIAGNSVCSVTILDNDHPLAAFIGAWTGAGESFYDGSAYTYDFTIAAVDDDATYSKLVISNFDPFALSYGWSSDNNRNIFSATVNAEKTVVTIQSGSPVVAGYYVLAGINTASLATATGYADITLELQSDGTLLMPNGYVFMNTAGTSYYESILGGIVFTKK